MVSSLILLSQRYLSLLIKLNNNDLNLLPPITIDLTPLPFVSDAMNLGVIFMPILEKTYCACLTEGASLQKLKFNKNSLSIELRIKLVSTLILPHIDYCCLIYHGLTGELNTKLQRLVNCCIRFNLRRDEHITPYRCKLGWFSVENRKLYFLGCQIYRIFFLQSPSYLSELFILLDPLLRRSDRQVTSSQTFHIPSHRTSTYRSSFHLSSVYYWHSLPDTITSAFSLAGFKSRFRSFLLTLESV